MPKAPKNDKYIICPRAEHSLSPTNATVAVRRLFEGAPVLRETAVEAVCVRCPSEQSLERYPVLISNDIRRPTFFERFVLKELTKACEACRASIPQDRHKHIQPGRRIQPALTSENCILLALMDSVPTGRDQR